MLPDYDAKAVAEVLGLAFLRGLKGDISPESGSGTRTARVKSPHRMLNDAFIIHIDDATMLIVESKARDGWAPFDTSRPRDGRLSGFENHVSSPSPVFIEKAVESGLPRPALRHVAEWIAGGDEAKVSALECDVVPKTAPERRKTRLSLQESERTERIARLFVHARRALGSDVEAREFMTTKHAELDGRSPIDAVKTDLGTRRTERILTALEYGLAL